MAGCGIRADGEQDVLFRIVALLVALADLADVAPGLPALRRHRLLAILSYGEAEGRYLISGLFPSASAYFDEPEIGGDPARLAASFRVLALALYAMLTSGSRAGGAIGRRTGQARQVGKACRRRALPAVDTS